jgi:hypothetical protein
VESLELWQEVSSLTKWTLQYLTFSRLETNLHVNIFFEKHRRDVDIYTRTSTHPCEYTHAHPTTMNTLKKLDRLILRFTKSLWQYGRFIVCTFILSFDGLTAYFRCLPLFIWLRLVIIYSCILLLQAHLDNCFFLFGCLPFVWLYSIIIIVPLLEYVSCFQTMLREISLLLTTKRYMWAVSLGLEPSEVVSFTVFNDRS